MNQYLQAIMALSLFYFSQPAYASGDYVGFYILYGGVLAVFTFLIVIIFSLFRRRDTKKIKFLDIFFKLILAIIGVIGIQALYLIIGLSLIDIVKLPFSISTYRFVTWMAFILKFTCTLLSYRYFISRWPIKISLIGTCATLIILKLVKTIFHILFL